MIQVAHLLDDFGMGGVVRALGVFEEPELVAFAASRTVPIAPGQRIAPKLDADVIITHFPASWSRLAFFWSLKLRNPGARLVHIEHSYTRNFELHNVPNTGRFRLLLRLALKGFDAIICVSNGQRKWLSNTVGIKAERSRTIYPWSGRDELLGLAPPQRDANSPLRLAAYGRYAEVKNFGALIDAVATLNPSVELHLAGSGPDEPQLSERASAAGNVKLHGQVRDIGSFLARSDAIIVPSKWEAFGLVATEARLAARPIIVADVDGLPEQVGQSGIAAECGTAEDIASAIRHFQTLAFTPMSQAARDSASVMRDQIIGEWVRLLQA